MNILNIIFRDVIFITQQCGTGAQQYRVLQHIGFCSLIKNFNFSIPLIVIIIDLSAIICFQGVVDSSSQRLVNLAEQWEKHRTGLVDEYRELKVLNANRVVSSLFHVIIIT